MDCDKIVYKGAEAKFYIEIEAEGFNMVRDDFSLVLSWGLFGKTLVINKEDIVVGTDGWFFSFDSSEMVGRVMAECNFSVPDSDEPDGLLHRSDRQFLCLVTEKPAPLVCCIPSDACTHPVTYTRTYTPGISSDYVYLVDANGDYLMDSEGEYMVALKESNE